MQNKNRISSTLIKKKRPRKNTKRKINPEFTTAIRAAKMIRVCAASMQPDRNRFYRLTRFILHNVIQADKAHQPGERKLLLQHLQVFKDYEFSQDVPLSRYLKGEMTLSIQDKIGIRIQFPELTFPENHPFCKIMLLGVGIQIGSFSTTSIHSDITPWLTMDEQLPPAINPEQQSCTNSHQQPPASIYLEITNDHPLFIVLGIAFADNSAAGMTCQAVKIIAVNV
jgi:hypothetical protein